MSDVNFNLLDLVRLQLIEQSIIRKANEINTLKKNEKLLKLEASLDETSRDYDNLNKEYLKIEHERKKLDDAVSIQNEKIKKIEKKLFSGTITSSKELVSYQEEMNALKQNNDELESREIEFMIQIDDFKPKLEQAFQKKEKISTEINLMKDDIDSKLKFVEGKVKLLKEKRNPILKKIPKDVLVKYEELRSKKGGIAVTIMRNGFCTICNLEIPAGDVEKIKDHDKIHKCPICGRMLIIYSGGIEDIKSEVEAI